MVTKTTNDIRITVDVRYTGISPEDVDKDLKHFYYYQVLIENDSPVDVQLLNRHWIIFDSSLERREVKGEGVVGEQPIIKPGKYYMYMSSVILESEFGKMFGSFEMQRCEDKSLFNVDIPTFKLIATHRLN